VFATPALPSFDRTLHEIQACKLLPLSAPRAAIPAATPIPATPSKTSTPVRSPSSILDGRLLAWAGDPQYQTFTRSALKPFQALPFLLSEGPAKFGLAEEEIALLCASHSGEEKHLAGVRSILGKIGLDAGQLECGCGAPLYYETNNLPVPQDRAWTPLHHNCSGKHSGFLAWCRQHGAPTGGYVERDHPLQRAIRARWPMP
jgi:L-asparaginase II